MKLLIIIGAGAVGKMTVGQELMKITDMRLYHNHIDNSYLQPDVVAKLLKEKFSL